MNDVEICLKNLVNNKSPGPDAIPINVLKYCSSALAGPLTELFNHSLKIGVFPSRWKHAHVTPILKKGSRYKVCNYRPISLLPVLSKIFEKLLHIEIYRHVSKHIAPEQHGFVSQRSTVTNLVEYTRDIATHINNKDQVDSVYTDFSKAFDSVDHQLLIHKIQGYGICGQLLDLLTDYLLKRTQTVVIDAGRSTTEQVTSGVPQGSILGPLLFTLFVNDITQCFQSSKCLMYADDLKIYRSIRTIQECVLLQSDLDCLVAWCQVWRLKLNVLKCNVITFTIKKTKTIIFNYQIQDDLLIRVQSIKDLGVMMSSDLSYNKHLHMIRPKAYRLLGLMKRNCFRKLSPATNRLIYISLVRPQMEYGSVIWNPYHVTKISFVEKVQQRFVKLHTLNCCVPKDDYKAKLNFLNLMSLRDRRKLMDMTFLFKIIRGGVDSCSLPFLNFYVPPRASRSQTIFRLNSFRIDLFKHTSIIRLQSTFNTLASLNHDLDINFNTLIQFKALIKSVL